MKKITIMIISLFLIILTSILVVAINNKQIVYIVCKDDNLYIDPMETHFIGIMDYSDFVLGSRIVDNVMTEIVDGVFFKSGLDDGVKVKDYCKIELLINKQVNLVEVLE